MTIDERLRKIMDDLDAAADDLEDAGFWTKRTRSTPQRAKSRTLQTPLNRYDADAGQSEWSTPQSRYFASRLTRSWMADKSAVTRLAYRRVISSELWPKTFWRWNTLPPRRR